MSPDSNLVYQHSSLVLSGGVSTIIANYSTPHIQPVLRTVKGSTPHLQLFINTVRPCEFPGDFILVRVKYYAIFVYDWAWLCVLVSSMGIEPTHDCVQGNCPTNGQQSCSTWVEQARSSITFWVTEYYPTLSCFSSAKTTFSQAYFTDTLVPINIALPPLSAKT